MIPPILAQFHPPTTNDFVYDCWGGSLSIGGFSFCMNFIYFLVLLSFALFVLLFYLAFRKPQVVPGKLQSIMESGVQFVRENIAEEGVIDPRFDPFDDSLSVDVTVDVRLVLADKRDDAVVPASDPLRPRRRVIGGGCPEETVRSHPDFQLLKFLFPSLLKCLHPGAIFFLSGTSTTMRARLSR